MTPPPVDAGGGATESAPAAAESRPDPAPRDGLAGAAAVGPLSRLVRVAVESDDAAALVAAAERELGCPVGLVGADGEAMGHAPDDVLGRRALAVAAAAWRTRAPAPPGWCVLAVPESGPRVAALAVGGPEAAGPAWRQSLDLVAALLADQLARAALRRAQASAFVARLVGGPELGGERARRAGAEAGVALAAGYRAAVLQCGGVPRPELADRIGREAARLASGALSAGVGGRVVLLHPGDADEAAAWFGQVVERVRRFAPSAGAYAIAADRSVPPGDVGAEVARLLRLGRLGPRAEGAVPVTGARQYALDRLLLDTIPAPDAHGFVEDALGRLIAWDHDHGSDLLRVLEAALDFPRHDRAAQQCFMHRNTFRHRLKQATDVLGDDLEDPDVRLALHVALKLRRGLPATPARVEQARRHTPRRAPAAAGRVERDHAA